MSTRLLKPCRTSPIQHEYHAPDSDTDSEPSCPSRYETDLSSDFETEPESQSDLEEEPELAKEPTFPNPHANDADDTDTTRWRSREEFYTAQGRSKSRRKPQSQCLVDREYEHWIDYCKMRKSNPRATLRSCKPGRFKAYLEWRMENSGIKKESTIKAYWRRLLCCYLDVQGSSMKNGVDSDIRDFIPTMLTPQFELDTSVKEKHAMHVQDLYAILQAHWTADPKACHGRFRVQMAAILLLCGATATRPQALVESSSARHSNKALAYEHIQIWRVRDPGNSGRTTTVALVNLVHIKNSGGTGKRKRFVFHMESIPAFCILSHLLSLAIADNAFRRGFCTPEAIFNLAIPKNKECLKLNFKNSFKNKPIFRDFDRLPYGNDVSDHRALPYHKCRAHFVWLGKVAGFEQSLELYQLRRASGRKLNSELTPEERNQAMGHHGDTYQRFYMPDLIERDFQSIYFGTLSQDALIRHAARMGITRDDRAPLGLTDAQKLELKAELDNDPKLGELRGLRAHYREKIYTQGFQQVDAAKGTKLFDKYDGARRKINSLSNAMRKKREEQIIVDFHNTIDDLDIEWQLNGDCGEAMPSRSPVNFEFRERAAIARLLSQPLNELEGQHAMELRSKFIRHLMEYCELQESRNGDVGSCTTALCVSEVETYNKHDENKERGFEGSDRPPKRQRVDARVSSVRSGSTSPSRKADFSPSPVSTGRTSLLPMIFSEPICLICIGDQRLSQEKRLRPFAKADTLRRHTESHIKEGLFQQSFRCRHPNCSETIENLQHFKNHVAKTHGIRYPVVRWAEGQIY